MQPRLFLIDAIGPFFRGYEKRRINWSKIPFTHLATDGEAREEQWERIREDMRDFAKEVHSMGYNAVTLDDLAHLVPHPLHEPDVATRIDVFREEFVRLFAILDQFDLKIYITSDIIPLTPSIEEAYGANRKTLEDYFIDLVSRFLSDFPQVAGLIIRIGESDGTDVKDAIRTRLHVTSPEETNRLLHRMVDLFEEEKRDLILRTWTVGAYAIGDLMWHRRTLAATIRGISSQRFILSMKHGESDFFRFLPLNRAFFRTTQPTIIEFQARREYEGGGEHPAPVGTECELFARELEGVENLMGVSVWCQTGGWHRFRRLSFLKGAGDDTWTRINAQLILGIFRDGKTTESVIRDMYQRDKAEAVIELLRHAEDVMRNLVYISDFAEQKLFFRRVRIPPLLHVYWDCLFINHAVRKLMRHFVRDPEDALRSGEAACALFPRMIKLAQLSDLPVRDIEHWRDFCHIIRLARRYYFLPYDPDMIEQIRAAKTAYKKAWPKHSGSRYRIKLSFSPFPLTRRTIGWLSALLLRRQRGYRVIDHILTINLLGLVFRIFRPSKSKMVPKFVRKSAMGVETIFK